VIDAAAVARAVLVSVIANALRLTRLRLWSMILSWQR